MRSVSRALGLWALCIAFSATARAGQEPSSAPEAAGPNSPSAAQQPNAAISGRIVDPTGVGVAGATVKLASSGSATSQQTLTDNDGRFVFAHSEPGSIHLAIAADGFATQQFDGNLQANQSLQVPQITLALATLNTEVKVVPPQVIAEEQIREEEKQKALGFIPNYYVSYIPDAVALNPRQKFELAWKSTVNPVTFGITGVIAGIQQARNDFSGYGQGASGYAKRFGAAYADDAISTMIGGAIFPSLFKQDPRYFYKGTGSKKSRLMYALANAVICKGDNGHWQANYSGMLGAVAAAGISNAYYPSQDRGADLVFQNALIGIGATAAANVLQEFVIRRFTPNLPAHDPGSNGGGVGGKTHALVGKAFAVFAARSRDGD